MNLLDEILAWSQNRPLWQRNALRRISLQGILSDADLAELTLLCKAAHDLISADVPLPQVRPLQPDDLALFGEKSASVALLRIQDAQNVNALAQGQTLSFGSIGLTVIYGDNASGKSGYACILKRACRARGRGEPILPNVFGGASSSPATALIAFAVDSVEKTICWQDSQPPPTELATVSIFDSHCASVYVEQRTDVAFRPFGLDLFDKLVFHCES